MKLNYECVRDVLLALEENLTIEDLTEEEESGFSFQELNVCEIIELKALNKYPKKDIFYAINKLTEAGYLNAVPIDACDSTDYLVQDITYEGHEFLQSIKSDTVWNDVKKVSNKVGTISFPIISSIAGNVISKIISSSLGLS